MATYHSNSSDQQEISTNLYQRDPTPVPYPETPANMMMYMNYPSSSGPYSDAMAGNSQPQQNCVDGQLEFTPAQQGIFSNLNDQGYNVWRDGRNELVFMHPTGVPMTMQFSDDLVRNTVTDDPQMSLRSQMGILHGGQNLQGQGLSLSLSTQIPSAIPIPPSFHFRHPNPSGISSFVSSQSHPTISGEGGSRDESSQGKQLRDADYFQHNFHGGNQGPIKMETLNNNVAGTSPREVSGLANTIRSSKYLKATQELLDEVVNVRKALKQRDSNKNQGFQGCSSKGCKDTEGTSKDGAVLSSATAMDSQGLTSNSAGDLSPAERQDLQNKVSKLLSMLDEVDRRYRQYYHQMQIVVSSFDVIAGSGSAKLYTALPLETISRHFRGLRDAISGRIKVTRRSLGEQNTAENSKEGGISRLRFVDQQLKQQKALQQLGMIQQHAWRPQRGLPENSVTVLRAWLFEHFLHPYPKDSDKTMLARQTGLTRSQVSNWFINARVRLWKPMVEEMYKEEFGDNDMDSNSTSETNAPKGKDEIKVPEEGREELQQRSNPSSQFHESKSNFIPDEEMCGPTAGDNFQSVVHGENSTDYGVMKFRGNQRIHIDGPSSLLQDTFHNPISFPMAELERFGARTGGVSLTLGLQHSEGGGLPISAGTHHNFIIRGDEMYGVTNSQGPDGTTDYDCMDGGNRRQRFSSSNILHDFVA
ncbi:hypothetical protein GIB67_004809 [Kingdonia uniflora]|uniref:Homeobox domain-containing protein n=1 Tax=Kingdonia uniflora TaxID=39325 RepID=A0A7J7LNA8_9MAGN|nr:hypothetical protein GIB67_004809 [Kingdonia uniflora]